MFVTRPGESEGSLVEAKSNKVMAMDVFLLVPYSMYMNNHGEKELFNSTSEI